MRIVSKQLKRNQAFGFETLSVVFNRSVTDLLDD